MVRKKIKSSKNTSIFAPSGKKLMIERNRTASLSKAVESPSFLSSSRSNKFVNSTILKPGNDSKRRKVSQTIKAIREIKKYQATTRLLIPKAAFSRLVREITQNLMGKGDIRFSVLSLMALQEATEMAIINLLEISNLCSCHAKRVTLTPADIRLTRRAFGLANPLNG